MDRYQKLIDASVTRWDVNFVLGEFIGELNSSHTYRGGGDVEQLPSRGVGMLGVDRELSRTAPTASSTSCAAAGGTSSISCAPPRRSSGLGVKEGDYVLAVNGVPLDTAKDPWASFAGLADDTVLLTVNGSPSTTGARQVAVKCLGSEVELRFREWIEERRAAVEKATGGKAGYIYVQSTGVDAQSELERQFMRAVDEGRPRDRRALQQRRPDSRSLHRAAEPADSQLLGRARRRAPSVAAGDAPRAARDAHQWMERIGRRRVPILFPRGEARAKLVGSRTWGGLIGISGSPGLVDGGGVTVPTFRMLDPTGNWFAEGHGVEPDIPVDENPTELAKGNDPQLERAIQEVTQRMSASPPPPKRPAAEKR